MKAGPVGRPLVACYVRIDHHGLVSNGNVKTVKARAFGMEATWREWSDQNRATTETLVRDIHLICRAPKPKDLVPLRAMMDTLRFVD